jgi:hypothetical protein
MLQALYDQGSKEAQRGPSEFKLPKDDETLFPLFF